MVGKMKKAFILLLMFVALTCNAQTSSVKVTLKSGVVISGTLKELVVTDHVTVNVSGVESIIPMTEVDKIEHIEGKADVEPKNVSNVLTPEKYGIYEITDQGNYPESFVLELDGQKITMMLVRGGVFNMGYDDRHSLSMKSEPVHQVTLSSFYISKEAISRRVTQKLLGLKIKNDKKIDNFFATDKWDDASRLVQAIADATHKPYRMVTEAEWEYASLMPFAKQIFGEERHQEWCYDFFDEYESTSQVNPTGPTNGKKHVTRSFNGRRNIWDRKMLEEEKAFVRIVINASSIK
jgi:hypothetical protein